MDSSALESATFYKKAVAAFNLPADKAEKIAAQMQALGVGRDDAYMLLFLATARVENLTEAIPDEIDAAGRELIKGMREALSASLDAKLSTVPAMLEKQMGEFTSIVAKNVNERVDREATRRQTLRLGGFSIAAALVVVLALGYGYMIGRDTISSDALKWQSLVDLPSGGKWLAIAKMNDIDKALAQTCALGERRVVSGGQMCNVPLFVTQPVASSSGIDSVRLAFAEYSNELGVWGLLGIGALMGFIGGRGWLRRS